MLNSSRAARVMFGFVAVLVAAALVLHFLTWQRRGGGELRFVLSAIAIALIFPSAFLLLIRTSP